MTDAGSTLQPAFQALQSGDRETARRLLAASLRADPQNVQAWLWMSEAVEAEEQKRECLLRALALEPDNPAARARLAQMEDASAWAERDMEIAATFDSRDMGIAAMSDRRDMEIAATAAKAERFVRLAGGLSLTLLVGLALLGFALVRVVPQARSGSAPSAQQVLHMATLWCPSCEREGQPVVLSTRIGASFYRGARAGGLPHGTRVAVLRYQWSALEGRYYALVASEGKRGWVPEEQIRR